ncbi:hypothetical protein GGR56DRAFT_663908 [Xylariaceae sp. FL0804]|nr:hypothetical protein GGR56DRAFT_663908 [Xylariaceae sp. FL0804]
MNTSLATRTGTMSAYHGSTLDMDNVHSPASDYSLYGPGNMLATSTGPFLYSQTVPADLSGSVWDATAEGPQNFQGDEDYQFSYGQITPRGQNPGEAMDGVASQWMNTGRPAEPKHRSNSRDSSGSRKTRTVKVSSHKSRPQMAVAQGSPMSNFDMAGSSQMDGLLLQDAEAQPVSSNMYHYTTLPMGVGLPTPGVSCSSAVLASGLAQQHIDPAQMQLNFDASIADHSPSYSMTSLSPVESRMSSPGVPEDTWSLAALPLDVSTTHTSPTHTDDSSPVMEGLSPGSLDQVGMMTTEDYNGIMLSDDMFSLPPSVSRRTSGDGESCARDHELYRSAYPQADGLFHCPWEGKASCNHKPEKLKCNYDKFVDSHLKPYRCKAEACENSRFSSTACLLRHEREAHAMHGHGDKPYMCTYEGCDRAVPGHGFPRQWNLKDHMRRVHNDNGSSLQGPPAVEQTSSAHSAKGRKRKNKDGAEISSSSRKHAARLAQAAEAARAAEQPLINDWYQHQKALQAFLQEYQSPDAFDHMQGVSAAREHMDAMGKISKKLLASKKASMTQDSYRRSYGHHG